MAKSKKQVAETETQHGEAVHSEVHTLPTPPAKKAATVYTDVSMTDGRVVKFPGDRKVSKEVIFDAEENAVGARFDFVNGETRSILLVSLNGSLVAYSACHGLIQKVGDEWSGVKEIEDIVLTCDEMLTRLSGGSWDAESRSTGDSMAGASLVIKALMEVTGKDATAVKAFLDGKLAAGKESGLTRQKLYASFRNPTSNVGRVIRRLEDERAAKSATVDADQFAAELSAV